MKGKSLYEENIEHREGSVYSHKNIGSNMSLDRWEI